VRGGRIKGSLSASGRDLHKAFSLEEVEAFALAVSHRQSKKLFSLRPLRLAMSKKFVSIFLKKTTKFWTFNE
jgi:hypothetical protein